MKVGDKGSAQRAQGAGREGEKRQQKAEGEKSRSFSELLGSREGKALRGKQGREGAGDEGGRILQEGLVQKEQREGDARIRSRQDDRGGSARALELQGGKNEGRGEVDEGADEVGEAGGEELEETEDEEGEVSRGGERRRAAEGASGEVLIGEVGQVGERAERVKGAESTQGAAPAPAIEEIAQQVVQAVRMGEDGQARRVLFLDVTVPGQGDLRIRLRQDGGGMELRMRADNDALARSVRANVEGLRERSQELGVNLTSIRVVR